MELPCEYPLECVDLLDRHRCQSGDNGLYDSLVAAGTSPVELLDEPSQSRFLHYLIVARRTRRVDSSPVAA